jgi:hypothetical protein
LTRPGIEPGPPGGKPVTNRLSYGAADLLVTSSSRNPINVNVPASIWCAGHARGPNAPASDDTRDSH